MRDRDAAQDNRIAKQLNAYSAARRARKALAFLLDLHGEIVARSPELETLDDGELTATPRYRLAIGGRVLGTAFSYVTPKYEDKTLCGFVSSLAFNLDQTRLGSDTYSNAVILELPAGTDLNLSDEQLAELEAQRNQYGRISNGVTIGIAVATALLLGIVASFLITRRLRRLLREVEVSEQDELPGHSANRVATRFRCWRARSTRCEAASPNWLPTFANRTAIDGTGLRKSATTSARHLPRCRYALIALS